MTTTINASTVNGFVTTADTSGQLAIQANGATVATAQSTGLNLASTGLVFSDSSTQTSGKGVAKAWVNYDGVAQVIRASFNVSSVTYNSTGNYTVNYTTAMSSGYYCASLACSATVGSGGQYNLITSGVSASSCQIELLNYLAAANANRTNVYFSVFSN